jgi:hypothetical protein
MGRNHTDGPPRLDPLARFDETTTNTRDSNQKSLLNAQLRKTPSLLLRRPKLAYKRSSLRPNLASAPRQKKTHHAPGAARPVIWNINPRRQQISNANIPAAQSALECVRDSAAFPCLPTTPPNHLLIARQTKPNRSNAATPSRNRREEIQIDSAGDRAYLPRAKRFGARARQRRFPFFRNGTRKNIPGSESGLQPATRPPPPRHLICENLRNLRTKKAPQFPIQIHSTNLKYSQ